MSLSAGADAPAFIPFCRETLFHTVQGLSGNNLLTLREVVC